MQWNLGLELLIFTSRPVSEAYYLPPSSPVDEDVGLWRNIPCFACSTILPSRSLEPHPGRILAQEESRWLSDTGKVLSDAAERIWPLEANRSGLNPGSRLPRVGAWPSHGF